MIKQIKRIKVSADGSYCFVADEDGFIYQWNIQNPR
jgi:hypothetical protein